MANSHMIRLFSSFNADHYSLILNTSRISCKLYLSFFNLAAEKLMLLVVDSSKQSLTRQAHSK